MVYAACAMRRIEPDQVDGRWVELHPARNLIVGFLLFALMLFVIPVLIVFAFQSAGVDTSGEAGCHSAACGNYDSAQDAFLNP